MWPLSLHVRCTHEDACDVDVMYVDHSGQQGPPEDPSVGAMQRVADQSPPTCPYGQGVDCGREGCMCADADADASRTTNPLRCLCSEMVRW